MQTDVKGLIKLTQFLPENVMLDNSLVVDVYERAPGSANYITLAIHSYWPGCNF